MDQTPSSQPHIFVKEIYYLYIIILFQTEEIGKYGGHKVQLLSKYIKTSSNMHLSILQGQ